LDNLVILQNTIIIYGSAVFPQISQEDDGIWAKFG